MEVASSGKMFLRCQLQRFLPWSILISVVRVKHFLQNLLVIKMNVNLNLLHIEVSVYFCGYVYIVCNLCIS